MKLSLAISILIVTGCLAESYPNDMYFHHHPEAAEEHAKKLFKVNQKYDSQGYDRYRGSPPYRNAYGPPRQRYPYRANYNGNGIAKRGIKYTQDGAIDWSTMAKEANPRSFYTNQEASENNYRGDVKSDMSYGSGDYVPGPRQLYSDENEQSPRASYGDNPASENQFIEGSDSQTASEESPDNGLQKNPSSGQKDQSKQQYPSYGNYRQAPPPGYNEYYSPPYPYDPYYDARYPRSPPPRQAYNDEYYGGNYYDSQGEPYPGYYTPSEGEYGNYADPQEGPVHPESDIKHAAVAADTKEVSDKDYTSGQGTFYDLETHVGMCGKQRKNTELVAALNAEQMGAYRRDNPNCGKMVEIVGPNGKTVEVELVDDCKTCDSGDLDLSPAAFEKLGEFGHGSVPIKWKFK